MEKYKDATGISGVFAFEIGKDHIKVQFKDGRAYLYNYTTPGRSMVEEMKRLAKKGEGLTTFINQQVREQYASRLK
jgi:hypothetical protein